MTSEEMKAATLEVLQNAKDVYDKDAIFGALFSAGVPFTMIQRVYREVGIENDLLVDTAKAKENIEAFLSNQNIVEFEDYAAVLSLAGAVTTELGSMPDDLVMKTIRTYFKEQEVALPRATREYSPRGPRGGKVAEAIANYAQGTVPAEMTRLGMYDVVRPHLKGPKNAYDQVNSMFTTIYAVHNNLKYADAVTALKDTPLLNLTELEAADQPPVE